MGKRVGNPFPRSQWAAEAYQLLAYMSVTMGYEFDPETAEFATRPRAFVIGGPVSPVKGAPGEVLTNPDVIMSLGGIATEAELINMAVMLGYTQALLDNGHGWSASG